MFKGFKLVSILILTAILLSGCGSIFSGGKEKDEGKSKVLEVSIDNASYVWLEDSGEYSKEAAKGILEVTLNLKNVSKSTVTLSPYNGIYLYEGENQSSPLDVYSPLLASENSFNGDLNPEKTSKMNVYFEVDRKKEYELGLKPFIMENAGKEQEEIIIALDTNKYEESFTKLEQPVKALSALIDTVFLDRENADFDSLVATDTDAAKTDAKEFFQETIEDSVYTTLTDEEINNINNTYRSIISQKTEYQVSLLETANGKAILKIDYQTVPLNDLYSYVNDFTSDYMKSTGNYDSDAAAKQAIPRLGDMMNAIPLDSGSSLEISLIEKDGKWDLEPSDEYSIESLFRTFGGGTVY